MWVCRKGGGGRERAIGWLDGKVQQTILRKL
jgi:hypothetical protein